MQSGFRVHGDAKSTFGKQVAAELRQIKTLRTRAKKSAMTVLYDIQERDQNLTRHTRYLQGTPHTPQAQPQGKCPKSSYLHTQGYTAAGKFHATAPCHGEGLKQLTTEHHNNPNETTQKELKKEKLDIIIHKKNLNFQSNN